MRRCMTPNPHVKTKMLSQIVGNCPPKKQSTLSIDYDNFIFADRVTNHKIVIGDAKNKYGTYNRKNTFHHNTIVGKSEKKLISSRSKNIGSNRQIQQINDCWNFMKTTKLFQMDSLKSKIFSKINDSEEGKQNNSYQNMHKKKKNLRQFIEKYIHEISIKQFRNYAESSDDPEKRKLFNNKVINLWKHVPNQLNKQNIGLIVQQILSSEEKTEDCQKYRHLLEDEIQFPQQERLEKMLMNHASIKHKQFQHLIDPKNTSVKVDRILRKPKTAGIKRSQFQYHSEIDALKFKELDNYSKQTINNAEDSEKKIKNNSINIMDLNEVITGFALKGRTDKQKEKRRQVPSNLKNKQKNLIVAVENGLVYDLLFLLIRWPVLLYSVDSRGNNLLHIAAKKNQLDIYNILLKKMGVELIMEKNLHGKTPIDLAKLFNSEDIINKNKQLENTF